MSDYTTEVLPLFDRPRPTPPITTAWATRLAALLSAKSKAAAHRRRILLHVLDHGPSTDHELQAALDLAGDSERPRRHELVAAGALVDHGHKKRLPSDLLAVAWAITDELRPGSILWLIEKLREHDGSFPPGRPRTVSHRLGSPPPEGPSVRL